MKKVVRTDTALDAMLTKYCAHLEVRNYSTFTIRVQRIHLSYFNTWAAERGIAEPVEVTRVSLEQYRHHVFHCVKKNGEPLGFTSQKNRLAPLRTWFRWMAREHYILHNPASELELPRIGFRLPRAVLTAEEAESILSQPNIGDPIGLRDRAILETFYSTGMRRSELAHLKLCDVDTERATATIRQGKGKKDRHIPLGDRAALWIKKYLSEARPRSTDQTVFLSNAGEELAVDYLTELVREYVNQANIGKRGACHMFRHTMATLMLEGGADTRHIQVMLGHADLKTTQIYTHLAIRQLQEIHRATHPGAHVRTERTRD
jgi:integrase/recombinase XerD